jgi:hypothetical protein
MNENTQLTEEEARKYKFKAAAFLLGTAGEQIIELFS